MLSILSFNFIRTAFCDTAEPWQLSFQDGASPSFSGIVDLHDQIMFYLIIIIILVSWMLGAIIIKFNINKNPIVYKYFTHGTVIELIWTITPAIILVAIAFPSFRLLYLMDIPNLEVYFSHLALIPISKLHSSCTALVPLNVGLVNRLYSNKPRERLTSIQINSFTVSPH